MTNGRDVRDLLEEMVEEIELVRDIVERMDIEDFLENRPMQHAVERSLEILGEASKGMPVRVMNENPAIPWSDMAQMRDLLIHAYHRVDPRVVWKTATEHALPLLPVFQELLARERTKA